MGDWSNENVEALRDENARLRAALRHVGIVDDAMIWTGGVAVPGMRCRVCGSRWIANIDGEHHAVECPAAPDRSSTGNTS